jgi:hypothetical protein
MPTFSKSMSEGLPMAGYKPLVNAPKLRVSIVATEIPHGVERGYKGRN